MNDQHLILTIEKLRERIDERFDAVDLKFDTFEEKFDKRLRKTESDLTTIKSVGTAMSAILVFFGWDTVKLWLTSLMKS